MFLCHINWNLNVISQFPLYLQILYWRYHRIIGGSESSCNSRALAKPWRLVNGQALLPARKGCCIFAAGDTHRIIVSCGSATMALAGLTFIFFTPFWVTWFTTERAT